MGKNGEKAGNTPTTNLGCVKVESLRTWSFRNYIWISQMIWNKLVYTKAAAQSMIQVNGPRKATQPLDALFRK